MKILRLSAENIKRLSAVEIRPDGSPVLVIGGDNEAGKSSVLDAIEMALGGEKRMPAEPIRRGAKKGQVIADLGDFIVTRRFTASGTTLTVTNRDGAKYPSPQALLDGLVGRLTFDPLAFASMKAEQQAQTLRALAKIDTSALEVARKAAYEERTLVNRDATQTEALLARKPLHHVTGTEAEPLNELLAQLGEIDQLAKVAATAEQAVALSTQKIAGMERQASSLAERFERLRAELEAVEREADGLDIAIASERDAHAVKVLARDTALACVPDRTALAKQIADAEERNRLIAANHERRDLATRLAAQKAEADALTDKIAQIDAGKAQALAAAKFPVEGLGLDEHGVTWQGLPFEQASTAIRTRVSVAIGLALNPSLKVLLVRNGNDLGQANLRLIAEMAADADAQVWIERIDGAKGYPTVVIEDGTVVEQAVQA